MSIKGFKVDGVTDQYDYNYLDNKPVIDNTPTQGSNNLVKSGGVYSALADFGNVANLEYEVVTE